MSVATMRTAPCLADAQLVRELVEATGFFRSDEVDVAEELVLERNAKGPASGYLFFFQDGPGGRLDGYACYGPTPCTVGAFDLYWIAVHPDAQGKGLGRELFEAVTQAARQQGGRILFVETSSKGQYASTRRFYERCGCEVRAVIEDFYDAEEHKIIYSRKLPG